MYKPSDSEERVFQFDEEMVRRRDLQAPVYHIGRGGAANYVDEREPRMTRLDSASSGSISSEDGASGHVKGAFSKLARRFS